MGVGKICRWNFSLDIGGIDMPAIPTNLEQFRRHQDAKPKPQFGPPDCSHEEKEYGFGLAGGGFGPYEYCTICYRILWKTQEMEEE